MSTVNKGVFNITNSNDPNAVILYLMNFSAYTADYDTAKYNFFRNEFTILDAHNATFSIYSKNTQTGVTERKNFTVSLNDLQELVRFVSHTLSPSLSSKVRNKYRVMNGNYIFDLGQQYNFFRFTSFGTQTVNLFPYSGMQGAFDIEMDIRHYTGYDLKAAMVRDGQHLDLNYNSGNKIRFNYFFSQSSTPILRFRELTTDDISLKLTAGLANYNVSKLRNIKSDDKPVIQLKQGQRIFTVNQTIAAKDLVTAYDFTTENGIQKIDDIKQIVLYKNSGVTWDILGQSFESKPYKYMESDNNVGLRYMRINDNEWGFILNVDEAVQNANITKPTNVLDLVNLHFTKKGNYTLKIGVMDRYHQLSYQNIGLVINNS